MTHSRTYFFALAVAILSGSLAEHAHSTSIASEAIYGVVTIYNKTPIHLNYQIRARWNGKWGKWHDKRHSHPRGGWQYFWFNNEPEAMQIRFDRIGGDGEYTERVYNLDFKVVIEGERMCRHKGRPYRFEFDRGGRLLDLYNTTHKRR